MEGGSVLEVEGQAFLEQISPQSQATHSMAVHWLIDCEMFGHYRDELITAIQEQGHIAKLVSAPSPPYRWDDTGNPYRNLAPPDACVVVHGDIELATRVHREKRWTPGAYCTVSNFYCSNYLCHLGEHWINADYMMLPFGELSRQRELIFNKFGQEGRVFIRPDSPLKLFAGQIATAENFDVDLEFMGFYEFPADSIVVVSSPKQIEKEWRFIITEGEVAAGCLYQSNGEQTYEPLYEEPAFALASEIAATGYEPDPAWIIDICRTTSGQYRMLEIGGFSFSDLYACDKSAVVASVSRVAEKVWRESQT